MYYVFRETTEVRIHNRCRLLIRRYVTRRRFYVTVQGLAKSVTQLRRQSPVRAVDLAEIMNVNARSVNCNDSDKHLPQTFRDFVVLLMKLYYYKKKIGMTSENTQMINETWVGISFERFQFVI